MSAHAHASRLSQQPSSLNGSSRASGVEASTQDSTVKALCLFIDCNPPDEKDILKHLSSNGGLGDELKTVDQRKKALVDQVIKPLRNAESFLNVVKAGVPELHANLILSVWFR